MHIYGKSPLSKVISSGVSGKFSSDHSETSSGCTSAKLLFIVKPGLLVLRVYEVLALSCSLRIFEKSKKPFEKRISPLSKEKLANWNLYNYSSNFPYFTGFPACSLVK